MGRLFTTSAGGPGPPSTPRNDVPEDQPATKARGFRIPPDVGERLTLAQHKAECGDVRRGSQGNLAGSETTGAGHLGLGAEYVKRVATALAARRTAPSL